MVMVLSSGCASSLVREHFGVGTLRSDEAFVAARVQGFRYVAAGPMVRSSYKAGEFYIKSLIDGDREKQRVVAV